VYCPTAHICAGNYLRLNAAYQLDLEPVGTVCYPPVALVVPALIAPGRETGSVYHKSVSTAFSGKLLTATNSFSGSVSRRFAM
jgi:hypothetical protein